MKQLERISFKNDGGWDAIRVFARNAAFYLFSGLAAASVVSSLTDSTPHWRATTRTYIVGCVCVSLAVLLAPRKRLVVLDIAFFCWMSIVLTRLIDGMQAADMYRALLEARGDSEGG